MTFYLVRKKKIPNRILARVFGTRLPESVVTVFANSEELEITGHVGYSYVGETELGFNHLG